jgi:hypothetical protein
MTTPKKPTIDIGQLLSQQAEILSTAGGHAQDLGDWETALDVIKTASRPRSMRLLRIGGQAGLLGIGFALALLIQFMFADEPTATGWWLFLILLIAVCLPLYALALWEDAI